MDMNQETKVTVIDDRLRQEEAETLCRWAAARSVYEEEIGEKAAVSLLSSLGAYFVGSTLTTLIPFAPLQIPVAVGTTYALGRVVTEWLKAGKPADLSPFKTVYDDALREAKKNIELFKNDPKKDEPLGDESKKYDL